MSPAEAIVILGNRIGNEDLIEEKVVQRLGKDDDVIHFIEDIICNIDTVDNYYKDAKNVAYSC
jgi:hypothetical protein